jgi:hypothetical protein
LSTYTNWLEKEKILNGLESKKNNLKNENTSQLGLVRGL